MGELKHSKVANNHSRPISNQILEVGGAGGEPTSRHWLWLAIKTWRWVGLEKSPPAPGIAHGMVSNQNLEVGGAGGEPTLYLLPCNLHHGSY